MPATATDFSSAAWNKIQAMSFKPAQVMLWLRCLRTAGDLKPALMRAINSILQPVRDHFANDPEAKELLKKVGARDPRDSLRAMAS